MDKEYIQIHSNIGIAMERHMERIKAEEEAEKAKREAEWQKAREEREAREAAWKEKHPNLAKYTYCSSYSDNSYSPYYGGYCKIHFYEWSDLNSNPRTFDYYSPFYKFLDECELLLSSEQNAEIKPLSKCFVTCRRGCKELIVAPTYEGLVEKFNRPAVVTSV